MAPAPPGGDRLKRSHHNQFVLYGNSAIAEFRSIRPDVVEAISDEGIRRSSAYFSLKGNLTTNLRLKANFERLLKNLVEEIRLRRAAADAHFQRRR